MNNAYFNISNIDYIRNILTKELINSNNIRVIKDIRVFDEEDI